MSIIFEVDVVADQQLAVTASGPDRDELLALTSDRSYQLLEFLELLERNPDLYRGERLLPKVLASTGWPSAG